MTSDAVYDKNLTQRQQITLEHIVKNYIHTGHPISSKSLVEMLDVSSATIRNEMAALEAKGLITSPHTSAGRIPTEEGYRYYVQHLRGAGQLTSVERRMIAHQFHQAPMNVEQWMRLAAAMLSRTAQSASLITAPISEINRLKHLELISTQGRLVLMVLVLHSGDVRQRILTLQEPLTQQILSETAARITQLALGLTPKQIKEQLTDLSALEQDILVVTLSLMKETEQTQIIYRDGLTELIGRFDENAGAEQALRILEEQSTLETLLSEANPTIGDVRVVIAGENRWAHLNLLSIVLGRYGVQGHATGTLGVLGPTRMRYGRAISAVRYMSDLMSSLMGDIYDDTMPPTS